MDEAAPCVIIIRKPERDLVEGRHPRLHAGQGRQNGGYRTMWSFVDAIPQPPLGKILQDELRLQMKDYPFRGVRT